MGYDENHIYLGNKTAPLNITIVQRDLEKSSKFRIPLQSTGYPFQSIQLSYRPPYYYLADGQVPIIFRGKTEQQDPVPDIISYRDMYFDQLNSSPNKSVFRAQSRDHHNFVLGTLDSTRHVKLFPEILGKNSNSYIENDGMLISDQQENTHVYIYFYDNQFIVLDKNLNILRHLKLINPAKKISDQLIRMKNGIRKIEAPQELNFSNSYLADDILYIQSNIKGQYEDHTQWQKANVIDLYKIDQQYYIGSFLVHHREKKPLHDMLIVGDHFYGLIGNEICKYRFAQTLTSKSRTGKAEDLK